MKNDVYSINTLLFLGGEPTLNGKMLEYIVDKLIEKDVKVRMFMLGINGLSYSEEMVSGLNKLKEYIITISERKRYCPGLLMISQSQFHKDANPEMIEKLSGLSYLSSVEKSILSKDDIYFSMVEHLQII